MSLPRSPKELDAINRLCRAHSDLHALGWNDACYAKCDVTRRYEIIEIGSTGVHRGCRDEKGKWWLNDDETYPSNPILYRDAIHKDPNAK